MAAEDRDNYGFGPTLFPELVDQIINFSSDAPTLHSLCIMSRLSDLHLEGAREP